MGIVSYEWNFGDETTETDVTATHTYTNPGTYTVTLTVKDAAGNTTTT
jgi:PKD repeat protein